ncbi:MAG: hypothetical protein KDD27_25505 [Saprospiraceae bacterium]|nr:hypothetical protein [Saprospiraceae bacterium]
MTEKLPINGTTYFEAKNTFPNLHFIEGGFALLMIGYRPILFGLRFHRCFLWVLPGLEGVEAGSD